MIELNEQSLEACIKEMVNMSEGRPIEMKPRAMLVQREWADAFNRLIKCEDPYYKAAHLAVERFNKRG